MKKSHIEEVRAFNRFYTRLIGLLDNNILNSDYTLPEVRILYEIYTSPGCTSKEVIEVMNIDKGYFSRILRRFWKKGFLKKKVSENDGRAILLYLTQKGKDEFLKLNSRQNDQVQQLLNKLSTSKREDLISHMKDIKIILSDIENEQCS